MNAMEGQGMNERIVRQRLVEVLAGGEAHVNPEKALLGVDPGLRHIRPAPSVPSVWEELEHLRIAQEDILKHSVDPSWRSPSWPEGYWPELTGSVSDDVWEASVAAFLKNLAQVTALAADPELDLTVPLPHSNRGHDLLRELLLVADHNAYHLGQIVTVRKLLGNWNG